MKQRIVAISDTHSKHGQIGTKWPMIEKNEMNANIIVHSGDISTRGYNHEILNFLTWFHALPYDHKIFVAGNHDFGLEQDYDYWIAEIIENFPSITYLQDSGRTINGIKFWGSPQTPYFHNWAFNRQRGEEIKQYWNLIPDDVDYLITHGPAKGVGDWFVYTNEEVGCDDLQTAIHRVKPIVHQYGHIHCSYGTAKMFDTYSINACTCDESYSITQKPIVFDIDTEEKSINYLDY